MRQRQSLVFTLLLASALLAPRALRAQAERTMVRKEAATATPKTNRTIICRGAVVNPGWILVNDLRDPNSCGGDNPATLNAYNVWAVERYADRPVGTTIEICAASPTPSGWVVVDIYRNRDMCGHPFELFSANVKKIRRAN